MNIAEALSALVVILYIVAGVALYSVLVLLTSSILKMCSKKGNRDD